MQKASQTFLQYNPKKYLQALAIFSDKLLTLRVCSYFSNAFRLTILESKDKYLYMVF